VRLTVIAVAIGLVGAVAMGRLASAVLFGVTPIDPGALAGAAIVLGVVSVVACYIPARAHRASIRRRRWLRVKGSSFVVRRSSFVVRGSSFVVRRWNEEPRTTNVERL
jgi:hypothetical protein